jgi:hypothetical protein
MTDHKAPDLSPEAIEQLYRNLHGVEHVLYDADLDGKEEIVSDAINTLRALAARVEALTKERDELRYAEARDVPDDLTAPVRQAFTDRKVNGYFKHRAKALEAVGNRYSKGALVELVAYLMIERDAALARLGAVERETLEKAAELIDASDVPVRYILSQAIRALPPNPDAAAALERALQAEREACADVALDRHKTWHAIGPGCLVDDDASACSDIAAAILARGKKGDTDETA